MAHVTDAEGSRRYTVALIALICGFTALRIIYIQFGPLVLVQDETYFWDWSRRLDLS